MLQWRGSSLHHTQSLYGINFPLCFLFQVVFLDLWVVKNWITFVKENSLEGSFIVPQFPCPFGPH